MIQFAVYNFNLLPIVVFNPIKPLLLEMKWVFKHTDL